MSSDFDWNQTAVDPIDESQRVNHVRFCSPFVAELIDSHPQWFEQLHSSGRLDEPSRPDPRRALEWITTQGLDDGLRAFRNQEMLRIIWRDLNGLACLGEVLRDLSTLAEICLQLALDHHYDELRNRFGQPGNSEGHPQRPVVLGLGKLGGGELNLSSDIDVIFCYPEPGQCDGPRSRSNADFFARLSRNVIASLGQVRSTGFCFRVDTRLRPFGNAGAIASSFAAMEQYYQLEGRNWERYALIKARPVAGDIEAGRQLIASLRPFVYRRYIDFGAIEALREMQALIRAETSRQTGASDIKRGPGGIREIEFLAQGFQLLRGGREAELQTPKLAAALDAIVGLNLLPADLVDRLRRHYITLRHVENRIQAIKDQQTHRIPGGEDFQRLREGMGLASDEALQSVLLQIRAEVSRAFDESWAAPEPGERFAATDLTGDSAWEQNWIRWRSTGQVEDEPPVEHQSRIQSFVSALERRPLETRAAQRLDRFVPLLLQRIETRQLSEQVVGQLLDLVLAVSRRSAYLALLEENPRALDRAIELFGRSQWVARRVIRFPELLDELIDPSLGQHIPDRQTLENAATRKISSPLDSGDEEAALAGLNYLKQAACLRLAVAWLEKRIDAPAVHRALTDLAEVMIAMTMNLANHRLTRKHGSVPGSAMAVVAYGSLGARELGFDSDLDLVFLYNPGDGHSDGERPLAAERWFARLAQRMVGLLTALTPSGKLYEIDTRLRPNGQSGLLVSSIKAYANYQQEAAWTWEAQALTRARAVAGDPELIARFQQIREECLGRQRDQETLGEDLLEMRARIRENFPEKSVVGTDTRHSPGGMVDIGFLAQLGVLMLASRTPGLSLATGVSEQLEGLHAIGWLDKQQLALINNHLETLRILRLSGELASEEDASVPEGFTGNGRAIADLFARLAGDSNTRSRHD